jgi:hypothetical protein
MGLLAAFKELAQDKKIFHSSFSISFFIRSRRSQRCSKHARLNEN